MPSYSSDWRSRRHSAGSLLSRNARQKRKVRLQRISGHFAERPFSVFRDLCTTIRKPLFVYNRGMAAKR